MFHVVAWNGETLENGDLVMVYGSGLLKWGNHSLMTNRAFHQLKPSQWGRHTGFNVRNFLPIWPYDKLAKTTVLTCHRYESRTPAVHEQWSRLIYWNLYWRRYLTTSSAPKALRFSIEMRWTRLQWRWHWHYDMTEIANKWWPGREASTGWPEIRRPAVSTTLPRTVITLLLNRNNPLTM